MIERHAHSRVEYMVKAKSQFKRRSTANNVEIIIPVPTDADSPKFKTTIGSVKYVPEKTCIVWSIKSFPVSGASEGLGFLGASTARSFASSEDRVKDRVHPA